MTKNEGIVTLARERFNAAKDSDRDERKLIEEDVSFGVNDDGCQWDKNVRREREGDNPPRPCLVTNKIPEKIDQVEGEFRQMKPSAKVRGVDSLSDPKTATIIGGIIRHIQYDSTASSAYTHSHVSTLFGGRGAWRIDIEDDLDDPFIRCIKVNRIPNVLSVYWDPDAKKEDKSDSNYFFVTEEMSNREYKNKYPNHEVANWDKDDQSMDGWRTDETVRVAEYWWKEKVEKEFYRIQKVDMDGNPVALTVDSLEKIEGPYEILDTKKKEVDKVKWGIMNYNKFVEGPYDDWPSKYIPIIVETGKEVNIKGKFKSRGMVRFAKGPQQMLNYWNTATTESIALTPKSPYMVTPKMIGEHQAQWNSAHTKNYPYLLYEPDPNVPGAKPTREMPPQMSSAHANELGRMEHDIMAAMGIYSASLGDQGQEKSGRAITARQRQGSIGSYTFTDKFQNALTYSTKIIIDLIPHVYDTERIIRITGEDGREMSVPINATPNGQAMRESGPVDEEMVSYREEVSKYINDLTVGKYDVVVTIGPSYTTQRQEASAMILDLIQSVPQIGLATADILIKNLDIPGADEIMKRIEKIQNPETPPDPKMLVEMRKLVIDMRTEDRKEFEAQVKAITQLAEAESKERGNQMAEYTTFMKEIRDSITAMAQTESPQ